MTFGAQKVTFWSLSSLFTKRGKGLFLVSFESNELFPRFGSVAGRVFHNLSAPSHASWLQLQFCDLLLCLFQTSRAAKRGCFERGGFPIWTCPSFFVLFCPFWDFSLFLWDFPDLLGDGPGIFPICPFPLSRPIKSTYEEQSQKGPRHNLDLSRKKWETPGFGNPPV